MMKVAVAAGDVGIGWTKSARQMMCPGAVVACRGREEARDLMIMGLVYGP